MTEMLERVARVIYESEVHGPDDGFRWKNATARWRAIYLKRARTVIAAMRDPSEAMVTAAANATPCESKWHCMIDAALSPPAAVPKEEMHGCDD